MRTSTQYNVGQQVPWNGLTLTKQSLGTIEVDAELQQDEIWTSKDGREWTPTMEFAKGDESPNFEQVDIKPTTTTEQ